MRRYFSLLFSILMVVLTTTVIVMIPKATAYPLDRGQIALVVCMGIVGYISAALYFHVYWTSRPGSRR
jgi:hypothetical protein